MKRESNHDRKLNWHRKVISLLFLLSAISLNLLPANIFASEKIQKALLMDKTAEQLLERAAILLSFEEPGDDLINEICDFVTSYGEVEFIKTEYYNTPFHDDVARTLRNIASLYMFCHPPMAEKYLSAVIKIQEKLYGEDSEGSADARDELGDYFRLHTMQFEKALSSYKTAKKIRIKVYGNKDPRITKNYFRLAVTTFYHEGRNSNTDKLILDSVRIRKNFKGETQVKLYRAFFDAGIYYSLLGDYSTSIEYLNKALTSEENKTAIDESEILLELCNAYLNINDTTAAIKYCESAYQKLKDQLSPENYNLFKLVFDQLISLSEDKADNERVEQLKAELERGRRSLVEKL